MLRLAFALMLAGGCLPFVAAPAPAQVPEDPGAALTRHLQTLAQNPTDFDALIGAGRAALAVGDPRAAITFFGRAEAVRPNDGEVKAGLGSAVVQLEQPHEALDYFGQAARLGTPDYRFAGDRGLAYDLLGDPRRAQQDYRLALQHGEDDEVRRRLALSLAIGGDRAGALAAIDAQLRRQDRSAWRTRAFIQALTGDTGGATETAASVMSAEQAQAMRPFFAELATLGPAQRAMAVHFGDMPSEGGSTQVAAGFRSDAPLLPLAADRTGTLDVAAPSIAPRRRPDASTAVVAAPTPARAFEPPVTVARVAEPPRQTLVEAPKPEPIALAAAPSTALSAQAPAPGITTIGITPSGVGDGAPPAITSPQPAKPAAGFADLAASIATLNDETASPRREVQGPLLAANAAPPKPAPKPVMKAVVEKPVEKKPAERLVDDKKADDKKADAKKADDKKADAKKAAAAKKAPVKPAEPSRHWVQIAGGANKATLPREFEKLQDKAPKLLGKRSAWTTRLNATNRLLVGPFKSDEEAQDFVNDLRKAKLSAFGFTSEDGQKIEKLSGK